MALFVGGVGEADLEHTAQTINYRGGDRVKAVVIGGHDQTLMPGLIRPPEWQKYARCAHIEDPDRFFPERGQSISAAKRLCDRCPARQDCLHYAIEEEIEFGVWGGMSTPQRRRYAFQQARQPEPQPMIVFDRSKRLEKMLRLVRLRYLPRQLSSA